MFSEADSAMMARENAASTPLHAQGGLDKLHSTMKQKLIRASGVLLVVAVVIWALKGQDLNMWGRWK